MSTHEAIAALPTTGSADKALIRAMCTRRFAYCLTTSESATAFTAADADTGVIPDYLIQSNLLFGYDPTDTTTAHDGTTCLVTSDGKRYKSGAVDYPWSVLTVGTSAQPASPVEGDRYLVPTAATGTAWAGQDGKVATFKSNRWQFSVVPIGRGLYAEDTNVRWYRNAAGTWVSGFGAVSIGAAGINITNMLGAKASFIVKVQNQTTNAPPASPTAGTNYIIGSSPTGTWAGNPGKIAMCLVSGAFTIIAPDVGDQVYDISQGINFEWDGTSWGSTVGQWIKFGSSGVVSGATGASAGAGVYGYVANTVPGNVTRRPDTATVTIAARRAGAKIKLNWTASNLTITSSAAVSSANSWMVIALYRDSVTTALAQYLLCNNVGTNVQRIISLDFVIDAPDALSHTYFVAFTTGFDGTSRYDVTSIDQRLLTVEVGA